MGDQGLQGRHRASPPPSVLRGPLSLHRVGQCLFHQGLEVLPHQHQPSQEPQDADDSIVPIFQMRKQRLGALQKLTHMEGLVEFGSCAVTRAQVLTTSAAAWTFCKKVFPGRANGSERG